MNTKFSDYFLIGIFLLLLQHCVAQRGYNYARPNIVGATGSSNVGSIPATPVTNSLRPIVAALPTGNAATAPGYGTTPTAFGAPSSTNIIPAPTAFGGYGGQAQRAGVAGSFPPTATGTGVGGSFAPVGATGITKRPTATQRPGVGIFAGNAGRAQTQFTSTGGSSGGGAIGVDYDSDGDGGDFSAIPGIAGVNYPIYSQVPQTSFDCQQQALPGYYADVEAQCQVFHICALNRTYSFLCPNGTVFSQETLVCVWWNQYDCSTAPTLYANNAFIYDYGSRTQTTNAADYQGIGGGARQQGNFPLTANTARTSTAATQPGNIYSGIRPTVISSGYGGISTPLTPAPTPTAFTTSNVAGRTPAGIFKQTATPPTVQTFPNTAGGIGTAAIGSTLRAVETGGIGLQQTGLQTAQLATSSTNREYLPPTRRP